MAVTTVDAGSRGVWWGGRKMAQRPICISDEMQELYERWYALCLAPRREQVVRQMVYILLSPGVVFHENLHVTPRALYSIGVFAGVRIAEM